MMWVGEGRSMDTRSEFREREFVVSYLAASFCTPHAEKPSC